MAQSWDIHTACLTAQERNRPPKYASQSALLPPTRRTHTRSHEISPELAKMGPWALGPRLGRAWAHWAHARWSKKIGIFECRGSTASFVPFPKIILSKRAYLCTKAERSHRFHILVNGCPIFVASDGSAIAQGASYENLKASARHLPGGRSFRNPSLFRPSEKCVRPRIH